MSMVWSRTALVGGPILLANSSAAALCQSSALLTLFFSLSGSSLLGSNLLARIASPSTIPASPSADPYSVWKLLIVLCLNLTNNISANNLAAYLSDGNRHIPFLALTQNFH